MRPINLIPQDDQGGRGPGRAGSLSYVVLGALVAILLADLVAVGAGYHPQNARHVVIPPVPPVLQAMQEEQGTQRIAATGPSLGPNLAGRYGLRDVRGHDHPILRRASSLFYRTGGVGARG